MSHTPDYFRALIGLRTITPLHAGVLGGDHIIDRPIHRDVHTQVPKISSNALKGALREHGVAQNADRVFGTSENGDGRGGKSGQLNLTDARLLLFPVRSAVGGWAWVTCPSVLRKFREEAALAGCDVSAEAINTFYHALVNSIDDRAVYAGSTLKADKHFILQHHVLPIDERLTKPQVETWVTAMPLLSDLEALTERLVIVSDENFSALTLRYTEVYTRNKINDATGATGGGLLFTEECLPAGSVLYALAFSMPDVKQNDLEQQLKKDIQTIRIGGNATLGKGFCRLYWYFPHHENTKQHEHSHA